MEVRTACPICDSRVRWSAAEPGDWICPGCDHAMPAPVPPADGRLTACLACGNPELYKKKDFPHWLGLSILTVASLAFLVANWFYWPRLAWAVLIASALVDGLLYLWVGDVVVCYRCGGEHRGVGPDAAAAPFELVVAERYRQEKIRRAQLQRGPGNSG